MKLINVAVAALMLVSSNAFAAGKSIDIMSYNVENLFDEFKDEGKNDWTFLPSDTKGKAEECAKIKSRGRRNECETIDWTTKAVEVKLSQLKKVVDAAPNKPDFIGVVEVENDKIVGRLAEKLGYKFHKTTNGPDKRGVDVAMMWNERSDIKYVKHEEIPVPVTNPNYPTRPILAIQFKVGGNNLTMYVNHWPSQGADAPSRVLAAEAMMKHMKGVQAKDKNHNFIAMGDFNTIPGDVPHPFHTVVLKNDAMKDVRWTMTRDRSISFEVKNRLAPGSYFFDHGQNWNDLDHFFGSKNLFDKKNKMQIQLDSFNIIAPEFATMTQEWDERYYMHGAPMKKVPWPCNHATTRKSKAGYSDHFPIMIRVNY